MEKKLRYICVNSTLKLIDINYIFQEALFPNIDIFLVDRKMRCNVLFYFYEILFHIFYIALWWSQLNIWNCLLSHGTVVVCGDEGLTGLCNYLSQVGCMNWENELSGPSVGRVRRILLRRTSRLCILRAAAWQALASATYRPTPTQRKYSLCVQCL